jgi:Na+/H+-dicarboxylate symporter
MSASRKILVGLVLGISTGLFLGDRAAPFRFLADGFIRLLQMTVLPCYPVARRWSILRDVLHWEH